MTLFQGRYRIESTRLKGWDYTSPGEYFVTICTKGMVEWFGRMDNGKVNLSVIGKIVEDEWNKTPAIRPYVQLDEWVIMPNHLHGIIVILESSVETPRRGVSTKANLKPNSLGSIINQFKSIASKRIRKTGCIDFAWQARFYDHVIRNDKSLNRIRDYIRNNPARWEADRNETFEPTDWI